MFMMMLEEPEVTPAGVKPPTAAEVARELDDFSAAYAQFNSGG